jgi:signal transduction histidine kinase
MASDVRVMGALIDQVSALAEMLSGPAKISLVPIDVVPFVRSAWAARAENGPDSSFRGDEDSLVAVADPVRLRQIVELLGSNILTAAPRDSRALWVSRRGQMAELRVETPGTPRTLSVTLARALVEIQGGVLEQSREDGATILRVLFPLAP